MNEPAASLTKTSILQLMDELDQEIALLIHLSDLRLQYHRLNHQFLNRSISLLRLEMLGCSANFLTNTLTEPSIHDAVIWMSIFLSPREHLFRKYELQHGVIQGNTPRGLFGLTFCSAITDQYTFALTDGEISIIPPHVLRIQQEGYSNQLFGNFVTSEGV